MDEVLTSLGPVPPAGLVFQIPWSTPPEETIDRLAFGLGGKGFDLIANLRLADSNPAQSNFDEDAISNTISEAMTAASKAGNVILQCDTFEDVDRGYSPRFGLVDRLGNLRSSFVSH